MYNIYPGDSLVSRARNMLFTNIMNNMSNFDYMIWQDDDVSATKEGIEKIIDLNLDAVALATPLRVKLSDYGLVCAILGVYEEVEKFLYKCDFAGFGFFALSKKACLDIVDYCNETNSWYWDDGNKIYDVFKVGSNSANIYESEDFYVCSTLRKLGYDIYVDSSTPVSHGVVLRAGCEINPQSINREYNAILSENELLNYWTPNDWGPKLVLY